MWLVLSSSMCPKVGHWCSIYVATFLFFSWTYIVNGQGTSISASQQINHVYLQTRLGNLLGTKEQIQISRISKYVENNNSSFYYAFRGLAYAEKPVGNLRFQDPIVKLPTSTSAEFINATVSGSVCAQTVVGPDGILAPRVLVGNEDCLYANVYIPARRQASNELFKIMVYFAGGHFIRNSERLLVPTPLLLQQNVIIITFNYRTSIFGYLSTGTSDMPGNYGSLDQIALLKWVQLYARDFGGDPNHVTLFGTSSGAVSIHYLLLTKLASGLFNKVIMESGSAFCERSLVPNPLEIAEKVGSTLGCPSLDPPDLVACISSFSMEDIMATQDNITSVWVQPTVMGPVIDAYSRPPGLQFLPDFPENLPVINKVPTMLGITREEGLAPFAHLSMDYTLAQFNDLAFIRNVILPHHLDLLMRERRYTRRQAFIQDLTNRVMQVYSEAFYTDPIVALIAVNGDIWANSCVRKTIETLCSSYVPSVYTYLFTHRDVDVSPTPIPHHIEFYHEEGIKHPILDHEPADSEEILYMLQAGAEVNTPESTLNKFVRNRLMSEILSTLWTSFANGMHVKNVDLIVSDAYCLFEWLFYVIIIVCSNPEVTTTGPLFANWKKWAPVCSPYATDPEYPMYEISLNNHRIYKNYRLKEAEFWWNVHSDTFRKPSGYSGYIVPS